MKKFVMIGLISLLAACTAPDQSRRALESQNLKNINITGYRWFGCGDDHFHTGFSGTGPNGQHVEGVVCSGFLKGATVRYD